MGGLNENHDEIEFAEPKTEYFVLSDKYDGDTISRVFELYDREKDIAYGGILATNMNLHVLASDLERAATEDEVECANRRGHQHYAAQIIPELEEYVGL